MEMQESPYVGYRETIPESYDCVVGRLVPSQRYSTIKEEEACQLWPEKKWLVEKIKEGVVVVPKNKIMSLGFYLKVIC
jgi:hypothetical protein